MLGRRAMSRRRLAALAFALCLACSKSRKAPRPAPPVPSATSASTAAPSSSAGAPDIGSALRVERRIGKRGDPLSATLYRFTSAAVHGRLWVARVLPDKARFELLPASRPRPLATILKKHEPGADYVALNGGFYDDDRPMGLVVAGGKLIAPLRKRGGSGVFVVQDGRPAVVARDGYHAAQPALALQSVDRLVDHGRVLVRPRPGLRRAARSAIAIDADGTVLLAVAFDARAAFPLSNDVVRMSQTCTTSGPTLFELAELLVRDLGARSALNLDGGSSTSMRLRFGKARLDIIARHATINALVAVPR